MELSPEQVENIKAVGGEGSAIRAMCQTEGFKILRRDFEAKIEAAKSQWLDDKVPAAELERLKTKARMWNEILLVLKSYMLRGDNAHRIIHGDLEDSAH